MKTCKKCGAEFDDKIEKCPECGEEYTEKKPEDDKKESESKKKSGEKKDKKKKPLTPEKKKRIIIISIIAAVLVAAGIVLAVIFLLPEKTPDNSEALETPPETISISDETPVDVTGITASVDENGKVIDSKGIVDKEGHRVYDTGYKNDKGKTIYTTGKKDSNGNILYTLNTTDDVGKLIYYTGKVENGKLVIEKTNAIPDYTTNENSKLENKDRYATTKTVKYTPEKDENKAKEIKDGFTTFLSGAGDENITKIISVNGGYVVTGQTTSKDGSFSDVSSSWKGSSGYVAKLDANGKVQWTYVTGGDSYIILRDVAELKDGSIVAVGETTATDTSAPKTGKAVATLVIKLNKNGEEVWSIAFPCNEEENGDMGYSVAATPDGGFLVGGEANETTGFFKNSDGDFKAYLFKFNKKGEIQWRKVLGGSRANKISAIAVNDDGEIFATCVTYSTDLAFSSLAPYKVTGSSPNTVLLKLDKDGNLIWSAPIASWGRSEYNAVAAMPDGGCVVGGTMSIYKRANGSYSSCYGKTDGYVIRFNKDGEAYWGRNIGGTEEDGITGITVTDKGIVVTGETKSKDLDFSGLITSENKDGFVVVLNGAGKTVAKKIVAGTGVDTINSVAEADGGVVLAGITNSPDGSFKDSPHKKTDGFVMYYAIS